MKTLSHKRVRPAAVTMLIAAALLLLPVAGSSFSPLGSAVAFAADQGGLKDQMPQNGQAGGYTNYTADPSRLDYPAPWNSCRMGGSGTGYDPGAAPQDILRCQAAWCGGNSK
jgi:hypothetical protein